MSNHPANPALATDARFEALSAYLDGELTPAEAARVDAELASDASLRAELDELAGARAFFAEHGPVAAPADFLAGVLAAVDHEPVVQLAWYRRPFGVPVEALAVAAAALLVIWVALPGGPDASAPAQKGAAAARIEPVASSSYESAPTKEATEAQADDAVAVVDEGMVDPVVNAWEPPQVERDAELRADKMALSKKAFGLAPVELSKDAPVAVAQGGEALASPDAAIGGSGEAKGTMFANVPFSYNIHTEDPQVLYRLAALAAKYRGEVTDASSEPMQIEALSGTDAATVLVQIPAHALKSFSTEIQGLGSVYTEADNSMFAGDPVQVRVSVRLSGGAPGTDATPPNAAQRYLGRDLEANDGAGD